MFFYLTIQYEGECGLIEGHAYSVFFFCVCVCVWLYLGPQVRMDLAAINFKLEDYIPFISRVSPSSIIDYLPHFVITILDNRD